MIKLDLDNISFSKMENTVEQIKHYGIFRTIKVYSSPSLDGYHIEIKQFYMIPKKVECKYRFEFGDDLRRLCLDMLSDDISVREVLFDYKVKHKCGVTMKFERKLMFKWIRDSPNDEWHKNPITKNSLTFTQKLSEESLPLSLSSPSSYVSLEQ